VILLLASFGCRVRCGLLFVELLRLGGLLSGVLVWVLLIIVFCVGWLVVVSVCYGVCSG